MDLRPRLGVSTDARGWGGGTRCGFIFWRPQTEDRRLNFSKNTRQIWGWGMRSNLFDSFNEAATILPEYDHRPVPAIGQSASRADR